MHNKSPREV